MKKVLLFVTAVVIVSLSSCKQDHCTYSVNGVSTKVSCEDTYAISSGSCNAAQLSTFKTLCKSYGGTLSK
jgi:hypothetical protein